MQVWYGLNWLSLREAKGVRVMMFNATFNNILLISWRSVVMVEEIQIPGENHRPEASH